MILFSRSETCDSMSFGKAKRFNQEIVGCGPPPTAYNPKHLGGGNALSFPKGERFKDQSSQELDIPNMQLTRSHSSSSVGSTESGASHKSNTGKKDHSHCNKQIADLEKELRIITQERNELFKQKKKTAEGELTTETANDILKLNQTIQELRTKLEAAVAIEEEKKKLETERDETLAELDGKQNEILRITAQIDEMKTEFKKEEETLQKKFDDALNNVTTEKKEMETQLSELQLQVKKLTDVEAELAQELASTMKQHEKEVNDKEMEHSKQLETIKEEHAEKIQHLENNLQQLVVEHDTKSHQIMFDYSRQIDELNQMHDTAVAQLTNEHNQTLAELRSSHQQELDQIQKDRDEIKTEQTRLLERNGELVLNLETKQDELATMIVQLEVANEKVETERIQAEERIKQLTETFQSDIELCKANAEEEASAKEAELCSAYEQEKSDLLLKNNQLMEDLEQERAKSEQLEQTMEITCQGYEDKLQRLNENNQTEKEILIWQMNQQKENLEQEFKASYDQRLGEVEMEFEIKSAEWETKMNRAKEDFNEELSAMISNHSLQLSNYRELHEAALESLEREKTQMMEDRVEVEKKLALKEEELVQLTAQMKEQATQLELDLDLLRESNNDLVADLLRVTQDKLLADERMETEKVELAVAAEKEKEDLVQSYENLLASLRQTLDEQGQTLKNVEEELVKARQEFQQQLTDKDAQTEEEIRNLHKSYERVIIDIEEKYSLQKEDLQQQFEEERLALKNRSQKEMKILQDEFCVAFEDVDEKLKAEKREIQKLKDAIQLRDKQTADEWIQRETDLMTQFSSQSLKEREEFEQQIRTAENGRVELLEKCEKLTTERDAAIEDAAVLQVQTEAQLIALNEQYEEERTMLLGKLSEQTEEMKSIHREQLAQVHAELIESNESLQQIRAENDALSQQIKHLLDEHPQQLEQIRLEHEEAQLEAVRQAVAPFNKELEALRKEREDYLVLKNKYQELESLIEPFREQLEMFEAEKSALLNQALFAENSMASLASKYTQLLGHQNSKQKIHHLDKLKQDIFNLRKELAEKNLALEKEKKARAKADAKLKELTGQRKFDPSEAFKVPENPPVAVAAAATKPPIRSSKLEQRKPLRSQPKGAFFISMAEVEAIQAEQEQEQIKKQNARRQNSSQFEAFEIDFGGNSRRETFDVPHKLNVTHNIESDKENSRGFPLDISGISISEDVAQKMKLKSRSDNWTSTPLQRHVEK